ncbi:MAG: long-chain fatty acid--CoA ligase [Candidatus Omnitrophica bacterium]|nr:long-chain fatty acid--CoA ligase [Candidatus Omnitrophota bacterium]
MISCTIPQLFFSQAQKRAHCIAYRAKRSGSYVDFSWERSAKEVRSLALGLLDLGLQPEDRWAIISENRPEWIFWDLAIMSCRALSVPIYTSDTAAEIAKILKDCEAVGILASTPEQLDKVLELPQSVPSLRHLFVLDPPESLPEGVRAYPAWLNQPRTTPEERLNQLISGASNEETATLIYTSGTTGKRKGVMLSHKNFLSNAEACAQILPISDADVTLSMLPLSHVFERMADYYLPLYLGCTIGFAESLDTVGENMLEVRPTVVLSVPRFFEKLQARIEAAIEEAAPLRRRLFLWAKGVGWKMAQVQLARKIPNLKLRLIYAIAEVLVFRKLKARLGGRLHFFVSGGAPLPAAVARFFASAGVVILEGYGLTETSPVIAVNRMDKRKLETVGPLLPGVEVRISEEGEILTRGPHVMQGYFRNQEKTEAAIVDGWFHTGDIGLMDEDGFLVITDRKKDLIVTSGGKNVAPQKIEALLKESPFVAEAMVYGDWNNFLVALLVPDWTRLESYALQNNISTEDRAALVRDDRIRQLIYKHLEALAPGLSSYEQVKEFEFLDHDWGREFGELTPTLKLKRQVIAEKYADLIKSAYERARKNRQ